MRIDLYLHIEPSPEVLGLLGAMSRKLDLIISKENQIMSAQTDALDQAEAAAKANSDADDSAEKLLVTLAGMIADLKTNSTDPATTARIVALGDALRARAAQLATAVASTPTA